MYPTRLAVAICMACAGAGCAVGPHYRPALPDAPPRFEAPVPVVQAGPDAGTALSTRAVPNVDLADLAWWRQFDDPLVAELVQAAQLDSPTLAQSLARVLQARAVFQRAGAARLPQLGLNAGATRERSVTAPGISSPATFVDGSLDASWEIDLFGARAKAAEAADARIAARRADLRTVRVSLAAEVAATLVDYRACTASVAILEQDLVSRQAVSRLTGEAEKTGYMPRVDSLLSDASVASARERLVAQRATCDLDVKALVSLTGVAEPALRANLANGRGGGGELPRPRAFLVETVPARALAQRPDIAAAERELAAAAAEINVAEAQRYPSLSLGGSIGVGRMRAGGLSGSASTWSFGPAAISLPLFDGGRRRADAAEARGRYDEQAGAYRQRVRDAVREIEEALVRLDAAARRDADADLAARQYQRYFEAGEQKFRAGASGLLDLEEARRNSLSARLTHVGVQLDRVQAWIALYRALGGAWQDGSPAPAGAPLAALPATTSGAAPPAAALAPSVAPSGSPFALQERLR